MQCAVFDSHAYTNKSTFDVRRETKFINIKMKQKERKEKGKKNEEINDITLYTTNDYFSYETVDHFPRIFRNINKTESH